MTFLYFETGSNNSTLICKFVRIASYDEFGLDLSPNTVYAVIEILDDDAGKKPFPGCISILYRDKYHYVIEMKKLFIFNIGEKNHGLPFSIEEDEPTFSPIKRKSIPNITPRIFPNKKQELPVSPIKRKSIPNIKLFSPRIFSKKKQELPVSPIIRMSKKRSSSFLKKKRVKKTKKKVKKPRNGKSNWFSIKI
jgi:hypothetical protein